MYIRLCGYIRSEQAVQGHSAKTPTAMDMPMSEAIATGFAAFDQPAPAPGSQRTHYVPRAFVPPTLEYGLALWAPFYDTPETTTHCPPYQELTKYPSAAGLLALAQEEYEIGRFNPPLDLIVEFKGARAKLGTQEANELLALAEKEQAEAKAGHQLPEKAAPESDLLWQE